MWPLAGLKKVCCAPRGFIAGRITPVATTNMNDFISILLAIDFEVGKGKRWIERGRGLRSRGEVQGDGVGHEHRHWRRSRDDDAGVVDREPCQARWKSRRNVEDCRGLGGSVKRPKQAW